jgi:hypothetical protein
LCVWTGRTCTQRLPHCGRFSAEWHRGTLARDAIRSRGGGGGAAAASAAAARDRARANIPTPTWRRRAGSSFVGDRATGGEPTSDADDDLDRDLSDEAYIRRHEPLAVEERRRWTGVAAETSPESLAASVAVASPSPNLARVAARESASVSAFAAMDAATGSSESRSGPVPLTVDAGPCDVARGPVADPEHSDVGMATNEHPTSNSNTATPGVATLKRTRGSGVPKLCVPLYPTPLECWVAVQRALQRHRNEAGAVVDNRRSLRRRRRALATVDLPLHAYASLEATLNRERLKLRRALNKRRAAVGVAPLGRGKQGRSFANSLDTSAADLAGVSSGGTSLPATSYSPGLAGASLTATGAFSDPSVREADNETDNTPRAMVTIAGSLAENPVFEPYPVPSSLVDGTSSTAFHDSSILDPSVASCRGPAVASYRAPSDVTVPVVPASRVSKSTILLEQAAVEFDEFDAMFRARSKKFLLQLKSLAAQAQCQVSRPANFANLQKDFAQIRKEELEAETSGVGEESKESVSVYIQRSIDGSLYPALSRSFALRPGYRLHGGLPGLDGDMQQPQDHDSKDVDLLKGIHSYPVPPPHSPGMPGPFYSQGGPASSADLNDDAESLDGFDLDIGPIVVNDQGGFAVPSNTTPPPLFGPSQGVSGIVCNTGRPPSIAAVAASAPARRPNNRSASSSAERLPSMQLCPGASAPHSISDGANRTAAQFIMASSPPQYSLVPPSTQSIPGRSLISRAVEVSETGYPRHGPLSLELVHNVETVPRRQPLDYSSVCALPLPPCAQQIPEFRWNFEEQNRDHGCQALSTGHLPRQEDKLRAQSKPTAASTLHAGLTGDHFNTVSAAPGSIGRSELKLASDEQLELSQELDPSLTENAPLAQYQTSDALVGNDTKGE